MIDLNSYVVTDSFFGPAAYSYVASARVASRPDGDVTATSRRIPNLAQAHVIVS